jgi:Ca2+-binding EF-hand superfamily protein
MDKNKTGMIDAKELSAYLKSKNESLSQQEVNDMIKELDYQGNGKINWSEFLAATIDTEKFLTE